MDLHLEPYIETVRELKPYFENWKEILREFLRLWISKGYPGVKLLVFGSILSGKAHPALSDIDVLILLPEGLPPAKIRRLWLSEFRRCHPFHPFEFHFADSELFKNWYSRFVKEWYEIRLDQEARSENDPDRSGL